MILDFNIIENLAPEKETTVQVGKMSTTINSDFFLLLFSPQTHQCCYSTKAWFCRVPSQFPLTLEGIEGA